MVAVLFYRCFLGWYILLERKITKEKNEFCLKVWKPLRHKKPCRKRRG